MFGWLGRKIGKKGTEIRNYLVTGIDEANDIPGRAIILIANETGSACNSDERLWVDCYGRNTEKNLKSFLQFAKMDTGLSIKESNHLIGSNPIQIQAWISSGNWVKDYKVVE